MDKILTFAQVAPLTLVLNLIGMFVFAISGAVAGLKHKLDLFGVLVLSLAAATAGGIIRDLLIGAIPPATIRDWRYLAVPLLAGLVTFLWHPWIDRLRNSVLLFDAAGLGLFAVAGTLKALSYQIGPVPAVMLGVLTGVGGGIVRDILVSEVPAVLRSELYAVAALAGSAVVIAGQALQLPSEVVTGTGALLCFLLRLGAIRRGWKLPVRSDFAAHG